MRTIHDYLNQAKAVNHLKSDGDLARRLNVNRQAVSQYRQGDKFPKLDTFLKLADLARIDAYTALLEFEAWRTHRSEQWVAHQLILDILSERTGEPVKYRWLTGNINGRGNSQRTARR
jgi:transcriptional regulator with XRE-family HTH domain